MAWQTWQPNNLDPVKDHSFMDKIKPLVCQLLENPLLIFLFEFGLCYLKRNKTYGVGGLGLRLGGLLSSKVLVRNLLGAINSQVGLVHIGFCPGFNRTPCQWMVGLVSHIIRFLGWIPSYQKKEQNIDLLQHYMERLSPYLNHPPMKNHHQNQYIKKQANVYILTITLIST